jgi:hypothetical protein
MSLQKQSSSKAIKRILLVTVFLITFTLGVVGLNEAAKAQENSFSCTEATLNGSYGLQVKGFRLPSCSSYIPFGATGLRNFDGNGNYTRTGITNVEGTFAQTNISGTYTVEPDCTIEINYTTTSADGTVRETVQSGVIVHRAREILTLQTSPDDNVQTGIYKKVRKSHD